MEKTSREYAEKLAGEFWQDDRLTKLNIMPNTFEKAMFIEGYMKAVEETNVKWISVGDKLPEEDLSVFCYTNVGGKCVCFYKHGNWRYQHNSGLIDTILNITHWMPLPDKPLTK